MALFDRQMRRDMPGAERGLRYTRNAGTAQDWNAVVWSDLDEETADAEIAEQVRYFAGRGVGFEWKTYGHDRPADLGARLERAGFVPGEPESLMIAPIGELDLDVAPPDGVRLVPVTDAAGLALLIRASESAFGEPAGSWRHQEPASLRAFVAMAGDEPISGARMEVHEGTAFASLWGGGTVEKWRGRGVYRALVACRARIAADLGYEYLQVDASDQSRPILLRLGFAAVGTTTPYHR
ncbi:N-acetyltransferase GCN5 [Actinoplanes sp. SE50]|uniref:GNAT family N-acetyltransferase n=1 Tax=unclassified Actinoplanes TaxID=2626549 RepID=UPI00023ECC5A|nr:MULTISPECIES: N-acetyltransferase GCN5 [unclassified Actinoplanes]AEV83192.1 hypothetical protein ACPL_2297 [Actinoplanes sp. SE50/110]ATO81587.1 N-acetyltransferase GCN5 [Actinoplanes sp. SE50]SLL98995.1 GCN5 family acetyltransferase [Actinoplanes sp. SE50/110]